MDRYTIGMILCGLLAIAAAILNLVFTRLGRKSKPFLIVSLVLAALTVFLQYAGNIGLERDLRLDGSICASLIAISVIFNGVSFLSKRK
jgi:hypothetical protein